MPKKKVKLAWIENDNSRAISLRKKIIGLQKKVKELTILCDVRACIIISSPDEVVPVVWPSVETTHGLLDYFFALPKFEQEKKATSVESYLQEKINNIHEQLIKINKQKNEYAIDEMMSQIQDCRINIADLNLSESYALLSFSRDIIRSYRKQLDPIQFPPLRDPPVFPFEVQVEQLKTTINDVVVEGSQDDKRDEATRRININVLTENKSDYLIDEWFFPPNPPKPEIYQQIRNENPKPRSYCPYQGSSSNGNHHLEMNPVGPQMMTFDGLVGSVSQPSHHHTTNNNPVMVMNQPRQYPLDIMSREVGVSGSYYPYQGSSSNGNPHLEMYPVGPQMMTFDGLVGSVSQPSHHQNMNNNPVMVMNQPRQYHFDTMSREVGVNGSYCPYQGSSSNGNPHLEMNPVYPQMMTFDGLIGSVSQLSQHHNMNNNPVMVMNQPRQYPFDIMNREVGVNRSYYPYQGSSSNENPHLEMYPVCPQMMTFDGLVGSISQPSQHHNMNNNPILVMSQPRQYPFDIMNREMGVNEEGNNINNSQFYWSNNTIATNNGLRREPPPSETIGRENNANATSFDINRD